MKIGIISKSPERIEWYSTHYPNHSFRHIPVLQLFLTRFTCDKYIVDADMLTDDHNSYDYLTRYFNQDVLSRILSRNEEICQIHRNTKGEIALKCHRIDMANSAKSAKESCTRIGQVHTVLFQSEK